VKIRMMEIECETMPEFLLGGNEKIGGLEEHKETNREKLMKLSDRELAHRMQMDDGPCIFCAYNDTITGACTAQEKNTECKCVDGIEKWLGATE